MKQIMKGVRSTWHRNRLRRRIGSDPTPEIFSELALAMSEEGNWEEAAEAAREGLQLFPFSRELQEILRISWERHCCVRAAEFSARIRKDNSPETWTELIHFYLRHSKLDAALSTSSGMIKAHPRDARSWVASGQVHLNLFLRDHLAFDGDRAIKKLRRAVDLDQDCFEARLALAEAYFHIGATSKAAIQIMFALELEPGNEEARSLSEAILALPPETADPRELLIEAEETDEVWISTLMPEENECRREEIRGGVAQLSELPGISRVVLCHRLVEVSVCEGRILSAEELIGDPLAALARQFRRAASLALKRIGFGAFEEAKLNFDAMPVLIFAGGTSVLLVRLANHECAHTVASEARRQLGTWTGMGAVAPT